MQADHQIPTDASPVAVFDVIETIKDLTIVIEQETSLLRAMKIQEMNALQGQKMPLIDHYEMEMRRLHSRPEFFEELDPDLKAELQEVVERLNETVKENGSALLAAKTANERLMQAVSKAVRKKASPASPYSSNGSVSTQKSALAASVHLNQCL